MADSLRKVLFTTDLLEIVQDFDCGGDQWAIPLNNLDQSWSAREQWSSRSDEERS